jgi:hypothetical protein
MKHPGLQRALAALDDARTELHNIMAGEIDKDCDRTFIIRAYDEINRAVGYTKAVMK